MATPHTKNKKQNKGSIIVAWCDNGLADGKFVEGLVYSILTSKLPISSAARVQGNQIGRQRQVLLDMFYDQTDFDWMLWVDSDIVLTGDALQLIWDMADAKEKPVVSGTYFISKANEQSLMEPYPALFLADPDDRYQMAYLHPVPPSQPVKVDYAGFGFLLMHRSVVKKMREHHGDKPFFIETDSMSSDGKERFISEDIRFFMMMREAGIPLYAHTGAVVKHMKRFAFDFEFYKLYWISRMNAEAKQKAEEAGA